MKSLEMEVSKNIPMDDFKIENFRPEIETKLPDDTKLRRFVDLPKLFDLLAKSRLILPRLQKLLESDPFECSAAKTYKDLSEDEVQAEIVKLQEFAPRNYYPPNSSFETTGKLQPTRYIRELHLREHIRQMPDDELRRALWYLEREWLKAHLTCCCWYEGDTDSDAMWKIYAKSLGAVFTSSVSKLKKAIQSWKIPNHVSSTKLSLARVEYKNVSECGDGKPWLIKREAFLHEKEIRLYCEASWCWWDLELKVDTLELIDAIEITPFAAKWQFEAIKEAIAKLWPAGKTKVSHSKHMRSPTNEWPYPKNYLLCPQERSSLSK